MTKIAILLFLIVAYVPLSFAYSEEAEEVPAASAPYDSDNRGVTKDDSTDGLLDDQGTSQFSG